MTLRAEDLADLIDSGNIFIPDVFAWRGFGPDRTLSDNVAHCALTAERPFDGIFLQIGDENCPIPAPFCIWVSGTNSQKHQILLELKEFVIIDGIEVPNPWLKVLQGMDKLHLESVKSNFKENIVGTKDSFFSVSHANPINTEEDVVRSIRRLVKPPSAKKRPGDPDRGWSLTTDIFFRENLEEIKPMDERMQTNLATDGDSYTFKLYKGFHPKEVTYDRRKRQEHTNVRAAKVKTPAVFSELVRWEGRTAIYDDFIRHGKDENGDDFTNTDEDVEKRRYKRLCTHFINQSMPKTYNPDVRPKAQPVDFVIIIHFPKRYIDKAKNRSGYKSYAVMVAAIRDNRSSMSTDLGEFGGMLPTKGVTRVYRSRCTEKRPGDSFTARTRQTHPMEEGGEEEEGRQVSGAMVAEMEPAFVTESPLQFAGVVKGRGGGSGGGKGMGY